MSGGGALEIVGDVGDRVEQGGDDAGRSPCVAAADGDDLRRTGSASTI